MERMKRVVGSGLVLAIMILANAFGEEKPKFGAGFQATLPAVGLSAIIDLDKKNSIQGILGLFSDIKTYSGRYLHRFTIDPKGYWNAYGYGVIGVWSYTWEILEWTPYGWKEKEETETVLGFGGGIGIEYNWKALEPNMPPVWWNVELGIVKADFKEAPDDVPTIAFGAGAHFRF